MQLQNKELAMPQPQAFGHPTSARKDINIFTHTSLCVSVCDNSQWAHDKTEDRQLQHILSNQSRMCGWLIPMCPKHHVIICLTFGYHILNKCDCSCDIFCSCDNSMNLAGGSTLVAGLQKNCLSLRDTSPPQGLDDLNAN